MFCDINPKTIHKRKNYKLWTSWKFKNFNVLLEQIKNLEAITHVDGTARVQSVTKEYNERFNITAISVLGLSYGFLQSKLYNP